MSDEKSTPSSMSREEQAEVAEAMKEIGSPSKGYMAIDEKGEPFGDVLASPPDHPYVAISATTNPSKEAVATITGAPITNQMNPEHTTEDPNLIRRNEERQTSAPEDGAAE